MDLLIAMSLLFVFGLHNSLVKKLLIVFEHLSPLAIPSNLTHYFLTTIFALDSHYPASHDNRMLPRPRRPS
jgi:hypothetical protein